MDPGEEQKLWDELRLYESILERMPGDIHARARVLALRSHLHGSLPPPPASPPAVAASERIKTLVRLPAAPPPRPRPPDSISQLDLPVPSRRDSARLLDRLFEHGLLDPEEELAMTGQTWEARLRRAWERDADGYGTLIASLGLPWAPERSWHRTAPGLFSCREAGALCLALINPLDGAMLDAVQRSCPELKLFSCPPGRPHLKSEPPTIGR
ncbi:MAG: hypothetical protein RL095_888 [Verrucomicrobiota bacterium]|jgi:hypothetical protein